MGNRNIITLAICALLIFALNNVSFGAVELKEEISLTGVSLKELIGNYKELSGLTEVNLKNYKVPGEMSESEIESFSAGYIERFLENGWQMVLKGMNKGKTIMIFSMEKDNVREKLLVVIVSPSELSEMTLVGNIELSSLDELRDAILKSMPKFEAFKTLEEVLQEDESSPSSQMGNVMENWIQLINQYGEKAPPVVFFELAKAYQEMGIYDKALELYTSLINKDNTPWFLIVESSYRAGFCSEITEKFDDAEKYYKMVVEKTGDKNNVNDDYLASAELGLLRLQKWEKTPLSERALMQKADDLFHDKRDYVNAIKTYEAIIDNMPNSRYVPSALLMTGIAYGRLGMQDKQIEALKRAVNENPNSLNRIYLGRAYQNNNLYSEALYQYSEIIKDQANAKEWQIIMAYYNAGLCAQKLGLSDKSKIKTSVGETVNIINYHKEMVERYGSINSPLIADVEIDLLKQERGDKMPFLGVGFRYMNYINGAYIVTVFKNGPSYSAGVQKSDLLIAIDSEATSHPNIASRIIARKNIGDTVKLTIKRGDQVIDIPVTLTAAPEKLER